MSAEAERRRESERDGLPLGQRLYDNWLLLMIAGLAVMLIVYTGWGLWEVVTMPVAELP